MDTPPVDPVDPVDPNAPVAGTPPPPDDPGAASKRAWIWAAGIVAVAIIVAIVVFVLASNNNSSTKPNPSPTAITTPTSSPSASATATATATASPTATAAATPTATAPATPLPSNLSPTQIATVLFPDSGYECGGAGGVGYSTCPVTPTLADNADNWRGAHGGGAIFPLCRCATSNTPSYSSPTYSGASQSYLPAGIQGQPQYTGVSVRLYIGSQYEDVVVIFTKQSNGTWLASDTNCDSSEGGSAGGTGNLLSNTSGSTVCVKH